MQTEITEIRNKVDEVVALAESTYGIKLPTINVRFDLKGKAAGVAQCKNSFFGGASDFQLRFNRQHIALGGQSYKHIVEDVVAHEVAHLVCYAHPELGRAHNPGWKRVCRAIGGNGERCYSDTDAPEAVAKQSPYIYTTTNGYEVRVSKRCHNKVRSGSSYRYKHGKGSITSESNYRYEPNVVELATPGNDVKIATPPVIPNKPLTITPRKHKPVVQRTRSTGGFKKKTNAEAIREHIRAGATQEECIAFGVNVLGMKVALARTYVKNNWNKA